VDRAELSGHDPLGDTVKLPHEEIAFVRARSESYQSSGGSGPDADRGAKSFSWSNLERRARPGINGEPAIPSSPRGLFDRDSPFPRTPPPSPVHQG